VTFGALCASGWWGPAAFFQQPAPGAAQAALPTHAVQAFAELAQLLDASPLRDALLSLVKRRS
jgi:hypothetical protein